MTFQKKKILVSAYACNPSGSVNLHPGEDWTGWQLVNQIARFNDVHVITHAYNREGVEEALRKKPLDNVVFHFLDLPKGWKFLLYKIEFCQRIFYFLWQYRAWRLARKLNREIGFDIAHHVTFGNDWIASFIGAYLDVPFIWGPVGGGQKTPKPLRKEYSLYGRFAESMRNAAQFAGRSMPLRKRCLKKARYALICNEETRAKMRAKEPERVIGFPVNGIPREDVQGKALRPGNDTVFRVIMVGRLHRLKGFAIGVKSFGSFVGRYPDSELVIVGQGPEEANLRKIVEDLGLQDKVRFIPWLKRQDVLMNMRLSDVFLFPSFRDGGGAVVVEAMASGLPVICLNSGGPGFHVHPEWGMKIEPDEPQEVAGKMRDALVALYNDRMLCASLGDAAKKRAEAFYCWDALGERIARIYDACLNKNAGFMEEGNRFLIK